MTDSERNFMKYERNFYHHNTSLVYNLDKCAITLLLRAGLIVPPAAAWNDWRSSSGPVVFNAQQNVAARRNVYASGSE